MSEITGAIQETHLEISTPIANKLVRCPDCSNMILHEGGCIFCPSCGWSECH